MAKSRTFEQALAQADEYRTLIRAGRVAEAEQVERTIDDLVGCWALAGEAYEWWWPAAVAAGARVTPIRRRLARDVEPR